MSFEFQQKWFKDLRIALREKELASNSKKPDLSEPDSILLSKYVDRVRGGLYAWANDSSPASSETKTICQFAKSLQEASRSVIRLLHYGQQKSILPADVQVTEDSLRWLYWDYASLLGWILELKQQGHSRKRELSSQTHLKPSDFKKASRLIRFWSADELEKELSDESIIEAARLVEGVTIVPDDTPQNQLQEGQFRRIDIINIFKPRLRLQLSLSNISDPLNAIQRVIDHLVNTLTDSKLIAIAIATPGVTLVSDETLESHLLDGQLRKKDIVAAFSPSVRKRFAVDHPSDPLDACQRVITHLGTTLSDANLIATARKSEGITIVPDETPVEQLEQGQFRERDIINTFTPGFRLYFAVSNLNNPLDACQRVITHLGTTLSDANLVATARKSEGITIVPDETPVEQLEQGQLRENDVIAAFTPTVRKQFALSTRKPLIACQRVMKHLVTTLSDANLIATARRAKGITIVPDETPADQLKQGELRQEDVIKIFSAGTRLRFASHNINDPLLACQRVMEDLSTTLSDIKLISTAHATEGITILPDNTPEDQLQPGQLRECDILHAFPPWLRLRIAVNHVTNPLDACKRIMLHLSTTLTDANILTAAYGTDGITILPDSTPEDQLQQGQLREKDIINTFTASIRLRFASSSMNDPLRACQVVMQHLTTRLTHERLIAEARKLGNIDIVPDSVPDDELKQGQLRENDIIDSLNSSVRLTFAVNHANPVKPCLQVLEHIATTLSDINIIAAVRDIKDVTIVPDDTLEHQLQPGQLREQDILDIFSPRIRRHFAVGNIRDPLKACKRVIEHLTSTLSDVNIIAAARGAKGIIIVPDDTPRDQLIPGQLRAQDILSIFTLSVRLKFAVENIANPLPACQRWMNGEITCSGKNFRFHY